MKADVNPNFYKDVDLIFEGSGILTEGLTRTYHQFFRILLIDNEPTTLVLNNETLNLVKNQVVVINPNNIYELKLADMSKESVLYYDFNFLDKKSQYNCAGLFKNEFIFNIDDFTFFKESLEKAIAETTQPLHAQNLVVSGIGLILLGLIFRSFQNTNNYVLNNNLTRNDIFLLSEIENKLNEDFAFYCVVSNLCHGIGISENKLYKLIKSTYNISTKEWISEIKTTKIKLRLIERISPYQIADELGFSSLAYMRRFFKQHTNQSINEYLELFSNK